MKIIIVALATFLLITSCQNTNDATPAFTETRISLTTHKLVTFSAIIGTKYLVVFESGLGNDHTVWTDKAVASQVNSNFDVLMYDRAGYSQSENGPAPRNMTGYEANWKA